MQLGGSHWTVMAVELTAVTKQALGGRGGAERKR